MIPKPTPLYRAISISLCFALIMPMCGAPMFELGTTTFNWVKVLTQGTPPDFTDTPGTVDVGSSPSRDEATRNGIWDSTSLSGVNTLNHDQLTAAGLACTTAPYEAPTNTPPEDPGYDELAGSGEPRVHGPMVSPAKPAPQGTLSQIGGGSPLPWESSFPAGGSSGASAIMNSNTGNRLTYVPLFSMETKGGLPLSLGLYHNSLTDFVGNWGSKWSSDFDARLRRENPHSGLAAGDLITVRLGDGRLMPYRYDTSADAWLPPKGIYDRVTLSGGSTHNEQYTLTLKNGIKMVFSHPKAGDSSLDGQGLLSSIVDRNGNAISISREPGSGRLLTVSDGTGRRISFGYDTSGTGNVRQLRDCRETINRVWTFEYTGGQNLTKVNYPALSGTVYGRSFAYDSDHNLTTETDLRGNQWIASYDGSDRLASCEDPGYATMYLVPQYRFTYTASACTRTDQFSRTEVHNYISGRIYSEVDEGGFFETYVFDSVRRMNYYRDKRGSIWTYSLDVNGNVLQENTPTGEHNSATYNSDNTLASSYGDLSPSTMKYEYVLGRMSRAYKDLGGGTQQTLVQNTYSSAGLTNTTTVTDDTATPRNYSYTYTLLGDLRSVVDPRSSVALVSHNAIGWVTNSTDQVGNLSQVTYDDWGRPTTITHPPIAGVSSTVQVQYDLEGNVTHVIDERGKNHSWAYNERGQTISYTSANGETETYDYNTTGFLWRVTNGRGKIRTYTNTVRDEVKTLTMPDGSAELWQYNASGDVGAYTNAYGSADQYTIGHTFDYSGRPSVVDYPTGTDTVFTYSNYGHTIAMTDASGTTTWIYDSWDNLAELDTPQGNMTYTYNRLGERLSMTDPSGTSTYEYDNFGRLKKLTNYLSEITQWQYDNAGRMNKRTLPNGTWEDIAFDARSRPTSITLKKTGVNMRTQSYAYDAASNVTSHTVDSLVTSYTYDNINQLTAEARTGYSAYYAYDANGNRASRNLNGVLETYTNDDGDKLTSVTWSGGSKSFTYDGAGRRKTMTTGGVTTTYNWDYESRITSISKPGMTTNTFAYNGLDSRVSKVDSSGTRTYRRNGASPVAPVTSDSTATYTSGISERRSGVSTFLHSGVKNTDAQSSSTSTLVSTRQYDAFGNMTAATGTFQGPYGYGGAYRYHEDPDFALKLLGERYLDASTGSFLSRDKARDGKNWYAYCNNNPLKSQDMSGRSAALLLVGGLGILRARGYVDSDGMMVFGIVSKIKNNRPWCGTRFIHLDMPHNSSYPSTQFPHLNSDVKMLKFLNHKAVPDWVVPLGRADVVKTLGKALVVAGVAADVYDVVNSKDPAKTAVEDATIWGATLVCAEIGTAICPGIGTVIGGLVGAIGTSLIVHCNE